MTGPAIRAAAYTRVSTDEQAREGYSLGDQERRCIALIEREEWVHVETYEDAGFSGSDPNRPAYRRLLAAVTEGKSDRVVVVALDRFGRDAGELRAALLVMDAAGARFVSDREHIDRATPEGRLQTGILGEFAEFERERKSRPARRLRSARVPGPANRGERPPTATRAVLTVIGHPARTSRQ
jgi:site-specific DNA recombinase